MANPSRKTSLLATIGLLLLIGVGGWLWFRGDAGAETRDNPDASDSPTAEKSESDQPQGPPPATVRFGEVTGRALNQARLVTGRVHPVRRSVIAAEESGRVTTPIADVGTRIEAGEVIARLNDDLLQTEHQAAAAAVEQARATIGESEAERQRARDLLDRYTRLREEDAVTEVEVEEAQRDLAVATARIATARAALEVARAELAHLTERLEKTVVRAPFTGTVSAKHAELGEWVAPGTAILTLAETERVDAVIDVPEPLVPGVSEGAEVSVLIPALGESFTGRVHRITPAGNERTKTFPVLVRLTNSAGRIKPGMSARAELPTAEREPTLIVPRDAMQTTPDGFKVFVHRGGRAVPVKVFPRFTTDGGFAVDGPLRAGEQVVIEGNERLLGGERLQAMDEVAPDAFDRADADNEDESTDRASTDSPEAPVDDAAPPTSD